MLLSAVSVLVVAKSSSEIPEGIMNNPLYIYMYVYIYIYREREREREREGGREGERERCRKVSSGYSILAVRDLLD